VGARDQYAIETFSLTKIFPDWWRRPKVVAVDDLNLKVRYNEIYGFLGPNGSGKTTTLKMLLNLLYPTRGQALVLGGSTADPAVARRIGYLPEESYLYPYLSARETLDFYGRLFNLPARVREQRIEALLEMVGLAGMANRHVGTFSKGMARRIGLAQALINDPELLILDEPTSGMDPIGTRQIKDLLLHLAKRGKTILLCSHLLADVEDVCDRIGILYGGRMQVEGGVGSLLMRSDRRQIVTGAISEGTLERIRQIVAEEGVECEVSAPMERLEQFFVKVVTQAQQENVPTSGAVNVMKIGGFLAEEQPEEAGAGVLESLVRTQVGADRGGEARSGGDAELEPVQPAAADGAPAEQEDRELLERLAREATDQTAPEETTTEITRPDEPAAVSTGPGTIPAGPAVGVGGETETLTERPTGTPAAEDEESVREDVLRSLLGGSEAGAEGADGTTETTAPEDLEEDGHA